MSRMFVRRIRLFVVYQLKFFVSAKGIAEGEIFLINILWRMRIKGVGSCVGVKRSGLTLTQKRQRHQLCFGKFLCYLQYLRMKRSTISSTSLSHQAAPPWTSSSTS